MSAMEMRMVISQRLEQKLKMTSQMIQSIEMLQLPLMVLAEQINQELIENPALEIEEPPPAEDDAERDDLDHKEDEEFERLAEVTQDDQWDEYLEGLTSRRRYSGDEDPKRDAIANTPAPERDLRGALEEQLGISEVDARSRALALLIVGNIDDNGYVAYPLEEIFEAENTAAAAAAEKGAEYGGLGPVSDEEAGAALALVQSLDPAGIGARTVEECLLLQLGRSGEDDEFEARVIRDHFDDLLHNRLPKVAKDVGVSIERVKEALEKIRHLSLRPGLMYSRSEARYIIPDVTVEEVDGEFVVTMNDYHTPRLRISNAYREMLTGAKRGSEEGRFIREKIQSAKWLIDAIEQRRSTVEKIARRIVAIQRPFMVDGVAQLKPLMMQEVADQIGMHVSTVSRAIHDKYMDTPQGTFAMRYFFTGGFESADGSEESSKSVMSRIKEMVDAEDPKKPLSDKQIMEKLEVSGISIARRTVAKYRDRLAIPSSRQRKKY